MKNSILLKQIIFIIIISIILIHYSFAQSYPDALKGDFGFEGNSNYHLQVTMKTVSVPFEGLTNIPSNIIPLNRYMNIQAGSNWRLYTDNSTIKFDLGYLSKTDLTSGMILDLGHCSGLEFSTGILDGSWGFAKYQISVKPLYVYPEKTYTFYLNCLDSKYTQQFSDTGRYSVDFYVKYDNNTSSDDKLVFYGVIAGSGTFVYDRISSADTINGGLPSKEFKVWDIIMHRSEPLEKNFFARTTPFPITPVALDSNLTNRLILGTKVILDTVYYNFGANDRWGYNTVIDAQHYYDYYYDPPIINKPVNNKLGETFTTPAWQYRDEYGFPYVWFTFNIQTGDSLILKRNKNFWVTGYNAGLSGGGDTLLLSPNSCLIKEQNAEVNLCFRGVIIDSGSNSVWSSGSAMKVFEYSALNFLGQNHTVNNGGKIVVDTYGNLVLGNNTTLTFDGTGTYLELKSLANVKLGTSAKIEFKNGAKLIADGATFAGINGATWQGIETENCGDGFSVKNCTFSNALLPIKIINNANNVNNSLEFIGNTFNGIQNSTYCVYINNSNKLRFQSNTINRNPGSGYGLRMEYDINESLESAGEESAPTYAVLILNNNFNGGNGNLVINCNSSAVTPIQIMNNYFSCNGNFNLFGKRITGSIKNNSFNNTLGQSIYLNESSPDIYSNNVYSEIQNITSLYSYPKIAPIDNTDDLIWLGGKNHFNSINNNNIIINYGYPTLDLGQNCFTKSGSNYHLYGTIELPAEMNCVYPVRDNIFNGSGMPDYNLTEPKCGNEFSILYDDNSADCNISTDNGIIWNIQDLGNGIYDTIFKSQKTVTTQTTSEDQLYYTATQNLINKNHLNAINNYKSLITNYPDGKYASQSLGDVYQCYENLDTLRNLTNRSVLYGNLKTYLENKITSGLYSDEFIDNAFRIILKCETNISSYTNALEGYEFISLYHPDATMRLYASWDYNEIQSLIGRGGAEKENKLSDKEYLRNRLKYFNEKVNGNPILEQVKSVYRKQQEETSKSETKKIKSESKNDNEIKQRITELKKEDEQISSRVISNIRLSKSLTKSEKLQREEDDLNMILKSIIKTKGNVKEGQNSILPTKYELSQNYPNPFNPTTKINFALPKSGFVTLKIYDILGREIKTLVNEIKQAGNYTVDFNAWEFSSGVYFYRLETEGFTDVKRMMLIK